MGIDVRCQLDVGMPQPLLHILEGETQRYQIACTTMPQFVKTDVGQVVLFYSLLNKQSEQSIEDQLQT